MKMFETGKTVELNKLWDEVEHMPFYDNRDKDAMEDLILSLSAVSWISVEDRLPNVGDFILVYSTEIEIEDMIVDERNIREDENGVLGLYCHYWDEYATHWLPLPKLPK